MNPLHEENSTIMAQKNYSPAVALKDSELISFFSLLE